MAWLGRTSVLSVLLVSVSAQGWNASPTRSEAFASDTEVVAGAVRKPPPHRMSGDDLDGDGLPDWWELEHFGNLDQGSEDDPDEDNIPNLAEYLLGTDPNVDNTGSGDACNQPPTLSVSSVNVTETYGMAMLAEATDPEHDQVNFAVIHTSICGVEGCLDEPEFFADPGRSLANLYWVPAIGRGGQSYPVTFYACDDQGACADPVEVMITVNNLYQPDTRIIDTNGITFNGVAEPPSPVTIAEGERLYIANINTYYGPSGENMNLKVEFDPPLGAGADIPRVYKTSETGDIRFKVLWTPNHTRQTAIDAPYTVSLIPCYKNRRAEPENWFTFNLLVEDKPLITYPQDYITVTDDDDDWTFDFRMRTDDYGGGPITFDTPLTPPEGSIFDIATGRFIWQADQADEGRYHKMTLRLHADGYDIESPIVLGVLPAGGNLIINPDIEFDENGDGSPDGWTKWREAVGEGHILSWVGDDPEHPDLDPRYLKSERTFDATAAPTWFCWGQYVYLTPSAEEQLPADAVYEIECTYRLEDVQLNLDDEGVALEDDGIGITVSFHSDTGETLQSAYNSLNAISYESGFQADTWNTNDGCYHAVAPLSVDWRTYRFYFTPPPTTRYAWIRTVNTSRGKLYLDHLSFRPVSDNPHIPVFEKSGTVKLMTDEVGEPFFAIGANSNSPLDYDGDLMALDELRKLGFNLMTYKSDRLSEHVAAGLYALVSSVNTAPYYRSGGGYFMQGYSPYPALNLIRNRAEAVADAVVNDGLKVLMLDGPDESNYRVERSGAPMELREMNYAKAQLQAVLDKPYMLNVVPQDWDPLMDQPHACLADIISFTWNCPSSYTLMPSGYSNHNLDAKMGRVGQVVRRWHRETADCNGGEPKPVLGFGFGVYWWAYWDTKVPRWHHGQFIPYHLQRFQVYNQIVNGACGARFYGISDIELDNVYRRYHWSQIEEVVAELASLYDMYAQPTFYDEWESDQPIEAMLKKRNDKIYLVATNPSEYALGDVTITLPDHQIVSVTALFEDDRTNGTYPMITPDDGLIDEVDAAQVRRRGWTRMEWARDVPVNPDGVSFTDTFIDYAVHIYEIVPEFEDIDTDGLPDAWEQSYFLHLHYGPEDDPDSDGLINIEEYNHFSDPTLDDSDGDGLLDGEEVHVWETDPTKADTDGDVSDDPDDNCPTEYNYYQDDGDADGVGDVCDLCAETPAGTVVTSRGCPDCNGNDVWDECDIASGTSTDCNDNGLPDECEIPGDLDGDSDVDIDDFDAFAGCVSGPDHPTPPPSCDPCYFTLGDLDADSDIDLADFAAFQAVFTGAGG